MDERLPQVLLLLQLVHLVLLLQVLLAELVSASPDTQTTC